GFPSPATTSLRGWWPPSGGRPWRRARPAALGRGGELPIASAAPGNSMRSRVRPVSSPRAVEKVLLINADEPEEVRVAVVEDGRLEEVYVEAGTDPTGKGNIYVGRVQNVERGIGAAFVDLGGGVTGFLHASDVVGDPGE